MQNESLALSARTSAAHIAMSGQANAMEDFQLMRQQADVLIKSGFLPSSIKTPEQAITIMLTGRELGVPTMTALRKINVIQGQPTIAPELMLALIRRTGELENFEIESSAAGGVVCTMKR